MLFKIGFWLELQCFDLFSNFFRKKIIVLGGFCSKFHEDGGKNRIRKPMSISRIDQCEVGFVISAYLADWWIRDFCLPACRQTGFAADPVNGTTQLSLLICLSVDCVTLRDFVARLLADRALSDPMDKNDSTDQQTGASTFRKLTAKFS